MHTEIIDYICTTFFLANPAQMWAVIQDYVFSVIPIFFFLGQRKKPPCAICFYFDRYMCNSLVSLHFFFWKKKCCHFFLCMATSNPLFAILELHQASLPLFSRNASFFKRIFRARGPGKNDYQAFCFSQV